MPPRKQTTTAIVPWNEKFAKYAKETKEQVKNVGVAGSSLTFGPGTITYNGTTIPGGRMECIIVGHCALNAWFETDYNPDNRQPPSCYAFSMIVDDPEMAPHEQASNRQSDLCSTCDLNQFGTAKIGKGKACSNNIRLGFITAKDAEHADGIATAELGFGKISPTNLKNYAGYVKAVEEEYGRPLWAVVTEISSHADPKTQVRIEFKFVELIEDDATLTALEKRYAKVQDALQTPFPAPSEAPPPPQPVRRGTQKFAGVGKAQAAPASPVRGRR